MSLSLKPPRPSVQWLGEPELAFAGGLTHIDPKVGIPASGPWSRDHANHPASMTAGFIGTAVFGPSGVRQLPRGDVGGASPIPTAGADEHTAHES